MRIPAPSPTLASALVAPRWSRLQSEARPELDHAVGARGRAGRRRRRRRRRRARSAGRRGLAWWAASVVHPVERWIEECRSRALRWDDVGPLQVVRLYRSAAGAEPTVTIIRQRAGGRMGKQVGGGTSAETVGGERGLRGGPRAPRPGGGGRGADPRRRRPLRAAAGAGGRAPRRQGPAPARRGRAEGRACHRPDALLEPRRSSTSTSGDLDPEPRSDAGSSTVDAEPTGRAPRRDRPRPHARARPSPRPSTASFTSGP